MEEVWSWLEGLVPRENTGESKLVLADFGKGPRHGYGESRSTVVFVRKMALSDG